ncbi:MAG TPA: hypothetical protein VE870_04935 [Bacteroidales bacterium]|nr:hypothetical protein [Bacteroidales bacterium]
MKKNRNFVLVLFISLLAGSAYGQTKDFGLTKHAVSPKELANWNLVGNGQVDILGSQIAMQESDDSKGIMLVSPNAYGSDIIVRYKVLALTPSTVLVALLSLSDEGEPGSLSIPEDFDGSLGLFTGQKENYFFAFKNAPHNVTPFVRKSPKGTKLGSATKNTMIAGVYYDIEIGKYQEKLWLSVDGVKVFEARDSDPLKGGHLSLRIRGTAGFKAGCLIKDLEVLSH